MLLPAMSIVVVLVDGLDIAHGIDKVCGVCSNVSSPPSKSVCCSGCTISGQTHVACVWERLVCKCVSVPARDVVNLTAGDINVFRGQLTSDLGLSRSIGCPVLFLLIPV